MTAIAVEKHYRVNDLAELWGVSGNSIRRLFQAEPGVLKIGTARYVTLSIPESVAMRVHHSLSEQPLKAELSRANPLGVVRFRDSHTGMVQKARHVLKRHASKKTAHGEGVPEPMRPAV